LQAERDEAAAIHECDGGLHREISEALVALRTSTHPRGGQCRSGKPDPRQPPSSPTNRARKLLCAADQQASFSANLCVVAEGWKPDADMLLRFVQTREEWRGRHARRTGAITRSAYVIAVCMGAVPHAREKAAFDLKPRAAHRCGRPAPQFPDSFCARLASRTKPLWLPG